MNMQRAPNPRGATLGRRASSPCYVTPVIARPAHQLWCLFLRCRPVHRRSATACTDRLSMHVVSGYRAHVVSMLCPLSF
jgi:hypothetical protein